MDEEDGAEMNRVVSSEVHSQCEDTATTFTFNDHVCTSNLNAAESGSDGVTDEIRFDSDGDLDVRRLPKCKPGSLCGVIHLSSLTP
jgi:hypothetical protein